MEEGDKLVKLTSMRKVISRKMLESTNQAAQAYMTNSIDATLIQEFREKILKNGREETRRARDHHRLCDEDHRHGH